MGWVVSTMPTSFTLSEKIASIQCKAGWASVPFWIGAEKTLCVSPPGFRPWAQSKSLHCLHYVIISIISFYIKSLHKIHIYILKPILGGSKMGTTVFPVIFSVKVGRTSSTRPAMNSQFVISFFAALIFASSTFCSRYSTPNT